jgi:membrane protein implicated in regulation of membrane protease activity
MSILSISPEIMWALFGIILVFCEIFVPNIVIMFFGGGAIITGLTTWLGVTPTTQLQILVFIISSLLLLVLLRKYLKRIFLGKLQGGGEEINFDVEVGKIIPVVEYIEPGTVSGRVRYQGANWKAIASEPIPPGESVQIVRRDNITLVVEKINKEEK